MRTGLGVHVAHSVSQARGRMGTQKVCTGAARSVGRMADQVRSGHDVTRPSQHSIAQHGAAQRTHPGMLRLQMAL